MRRNIIEIDTFLKMYGLNKEIREEYLQINCLSSMKDYELETLNSLFLQLSPLLTIPTQKMGYLVDKSVRCGIKEQFDILRFANRTALNIELKYSIPKHGLPGILYQLRRHEHLLKNVCDAASAPNTKVPISATLRYISNIFSLGHNVSIHKVKYTSNALRM